jgi:hypothetical protein
MREGIDSGRAAGAIANARHFLGRVRRATPRKILRRILRPGDSSGALQVEEIAPAVPEPAVLAEPVVPEMAPVPQKRPILDPLSDELIALNAANAAAEGVASAVHVKDFIYWFCASHELFTSESGTRLYFQDGGNSARQLTELVSSLGYSSERPVKLLEFASGYGCVTRHLRKYPGLDLVSSDIHPEAMEFIAKELGGKTLLSAHAPEDFSPPERYDVVFALSFFTHMPKSTFGRWLKALFSALEPSGHLVFTTHGLKKCAGFGITPEEIPADGFWFKGWSEQKDLDTEEYGMTITTPDFVIGEIYRQLRSPIAVFRHGYWWGDQDLWVVQRQS